MYARSSNRGMSQKVNVPSVVKEHLLTRHVPKFMAGSSLGKLGPKPLSLQQSKMIIGANGLLKNMYQVNQQQHYRNFHSTTSIKMPIKTNPGCQVHDYVIVGAGSAGCVLANRLSVDNHNTVRLLEAGPVDNSWIIRMPEKFMKVISAPQFNWDYNTKVQPRLNNRQMYYPRGKVLGGTSSLNAMIYIRGHPYDYDRWEKEGATGWAFDSCLPYFKKSQSHENGGNLYRGGDGPLTVSQSKVDQVLHKAWVKAGIQAGYGSTDDFNGHKQEGFGEYHFTINKGIRWSSSKAYLEPALKRSNLTVTTDVLVTRVLFDHKRAIGIEMLNSQGQLEKIMAAKEVILSGGAINSSQVLMLSGVGNGDELKQHSIDVVHHIPGVGKNLQDHPSIAVQHKSKKPIARFSQQSTINRNLIDLQWFLFKSGLGTSNQGETGGFIRSEPGVAHPDIQFHFLQSLFRDHGRQPEPYDAFQALVSTLRSQSKGTISLQSNDPRQHPIIDPNYCSFERDFWELRKGIRVAREVFAQSAFDEFKGTEIVPGPEVQSDAQLNEFIKAGCQHLYHSTSTCKMGSTNDNEVVVDPQCRVVGLDNLRVVDASIMPSIVSGNTNAPTIMIAEKVADMILGNAPLSKIENVPIWNPKYPHKQRESNKD